MKYDQFSLFEYGTFSSLLYGIASPEQKQECIAKYIIEKNVSFVDMMPGLPAVVHAILSTPQEKKNQAFACFIIVPKGFDYEDKCALIDVSRITDIEECKDIMKVGKKFEEIIGEVPNKDYIWHIWDKDLNLLNSKGQYDKLKQEKK